MANIWFDSTKNRLFLCAELNQETMRTFFLSILLLGISVISIAQVIHIPTDHATIQDGLNAASFGDTVLVAPGTYFENIVWPNTNGIKLIAEGDTSDTFIDGGGIARCFKLTFPSIDTNTVLYGFTLRNGYANDTLQGGGGLVFNNCSPILDHCRITQNIGGFDYGVGALLWNSNAIIRNSSIDENVRYTHESAGQKGVGIMVVWGSRPTFDNVSISNNHYEGGVIKGVGLSVESNCHVRITNSKINGNTASCGYDVFGVGVYLGNHSTMSMDNCVIEENSSLQEARNQSGIAIFGTSVELSNTSIARNHASAATEIQGGTIVTASSLQLNQVDFIDNSFEGGISTQTVGMISIGYGESSFNSVRILRNTMTVSTQYHTLNGLVLRANYGDLVLTNCLIAENSPTFYSPGHQYNSVIMASNMNSLSIVNTTITDNFELLSSSFATPTIKCDTSSLTIVNSIIENPNLQSEIEGTNVSVEYSNVKGGYLGTGNIDADPMFIGSGDYRLQTFSPCINSGTLVGAPLTDIEGNPHPMPVGTNPDMGAYEDDNPSTSIEERAAENEFMIYPNPTTRMIHFNTEKKVLSVRVFNTLGAMVKEISDSPTAIDLSNLPPGVYVINTATQNGLFSNRIVLGS